MEKLGTIPLSKDILGKASIGLWAFELDEGRPPRMYVDETMARLLGMTEPLSPEDTYHAWYDHVDERHYGIVSEAVEKMVAGLHAEVQYPWHHPDGRLVYVRCGGVRNDAYTQGVRIEGCHSDVTELIHFQNEKEQQAERLAKALEEAKAAEQTKSAFLATMSHEIRTPLNAVIGFAEFLQDPGLSEEERRSYLTGITRSSNALLSLINDILDLSKLDAGKIVVRGGVCHLPKLFDEMKSIFHFNAERKGIEIGCRIADDFPAVALKEERVRQILLNLVGNAVKFTNSGSVSCSAEWRPGTPGHGTMTMQVRDTGIGIPKAKQDEIFNPFVQGENVRGGRVYQGTGLGLPICRRLVEAVGGAISLESDAGKGATFTVVIPDVEVSSDADDMAEAACETGDENAVLADPAHVQVVAVDDVPLNLVVAKKFCEMAGVPKENIRTFLGARKALTYLTEDGLEGFACTVVLTDMWMPEMTGEEFVRALRANPVLRGLPVVAVTADAETEGSYDMSLFDEVITKPITGAKVRASLARQTCRSRPAAVES